MTFNFTAADLKQLPDEEVQKALSNLSPRQLEELRFDWNFWARPKQRTPKGNWKLWFLNCGRSFGKTRTGAEWVREKVKSGCKRIAIVTSTNSDIEKVVVTGESGILNCCCQYDKTKRGTLIGRPTWSPTKRTLFWWKDGRETGKEKDIVARAQCFSAEEPERLRGPQFEAAWLDELGSWNKDQATYDMLRFCLRLGKNPQTCITTTPRSTALIRSIAKRCKDDPENYIMTTGSSFENDSPEVDLSAYKDFEGTRLGRQELYAEILAENEGALWTAEMIDNCQISLDEVPQLYRKIVAVDPAVSANVESDLTGIVLAGMDINGIVYVLGDYSRKELPEVWGKFCAELFYEKECDRLVYESNQGKDMIPPLFRVIDENIPLKGVHASTAKIARAEPVSALYERGKVMHVRNPEDPEASLTELETQLTAFEPRGKYKSPDRYDALVWAVTELALKGYSRPKLTLGYSNAESLSNH